MLRRPGPVPGAALERPLEAARAFPLSSVDDEDDEAHRGAPTRLRPCERFALRRRVEKAVAEAVGDDAQSEL